MPLDMVRAAFYYVAHDKTVTPADLLDDHALERLIDDAVGETDLADGDGIPGLEDSAGVDAAEAAR
jgi:hypothetical protein